MPAALGGKRRRFYFLCPIRSSEVNNSNPHGGKCSFCNSAESQNGRYSPIRATRRVIYMPAKNTSHLPIELKQVTKIEYESAGYVRRGIVLGESAILPSMALLHYFQVCSVSGWMHHDQEVR